MKNGYITFRSVTYAQKGETLLRRNGMNASLQRTPKWMEELGCGYCLRLPHKDLTAAVRILRGQNVSFRKVYVHLDSGLTEEVSL